MDEIETNCDGERSSSPPLPSRLRFSSSVSRARDAIYDDSDDDDNGAPGVNYEDEDDLSDLLYLEESRPTRIQHSPELERDTNPTDSLPRKRRRTSGTDKVIDEVISISSSPSPEQGHAPLISDDDELSTGLSHRDSPTAPDPPGDDIDADATSSPSGPAHSTAPTRFRMPTPAIFPTPTPSSIRPSFKLPQLHSAAAEDPSMGLSSLPNAFSPSRRRGRRDYVPGGAADTVRSWVLGLAEQESNTTASSTAPAGPECIRVVEVRDNDDGGGSTGRCVLVKDEKERRWVLINNETARAGGGGGALGVGGGEATEKNRKVKVGSKIEIRSSTIPSLRLGHRSAERSEGGWGDVMTPHEEDEDEWFVGIMWNVLV